MAHTLPCRWSVHCHAMPLVGALPCRAVGRCTAMLCCWSVHCHAVGRCTAMPSVHCHAVGRCRCGDWDLGRALPIECARKGIEEPTGAAVAIPEVRGVPCRLRRGS